MLETLRRGVRGGTGPFALHWMLMPVGRSPAHCGSISSCVGLLFLTAPGRGFPIVVESMDSKIQIGVLKFHIEFLSFLPARGLPLSGRGGKTG